MKTGKFYWEFGPYLWRDNSNHCQPGVAAMNLAQGYEMGGPLITQHSIIILELSILMVLRIGTAFGQVLE